MPSDASDRAARWRGLAVESRAVAEELTDPQARLILLTIARSYERLAERAEARKGNKGPEN